MGLNCCADSDNYLLLDKMSYIMTHPQLLDEKYMGRPVRET